jgi:hypothetical protein
MLAGVRRELEDRFAETVRAGLAAPGTRRPRFEPALPPAIRETMISVAALEGGCPEPLAAYYCDRMPSMLVEQMLRGEDRARRLLWLPLQLDRLPRLSQALDRLFAALGPTDAPALTGADSPADLLAQRPCAAALAAPTLLGSGLPLVGAWPAERALMEEELQSRTPEEVFDLRLSGGLMHELCHGLSRPLAAPPPPWMVLEAAALYLGSIAFPRHVFPEVPGEAVPGVSLFVLVGQCLARLFGRSALLQTVVRAAPLREAFGAPVAVALEAAARQDWLARREVPFARDALSAPAWVKLADAARSAGPPDPARPALLAWAGALKFADLPWWLEEPAQEDLDLARSAVRALFQANVLAPTYQTHPCPAPLLFLDAETCLLTRPARKEGVFGEPAFWIYPPPLCRLLRERGAAQVAIEGARPESADALLDLALGAGPLQTRTVLRWTSSV